MKSTWANTTAKPICSVFRRQALLCLLSQFPQLDLQLQPDAHRHALKLDKFSDDHDGSNYPAIDYAVQIWSKKRGKVHCYDPGDVINDLCILVAVGEINKFLNACIRLGGFAQPGGENKIKLVAFQSSELM